ncbi:MAG: IS3 family transposase, partial [Psychromonas sp.]|nr:IS3 family transposase [Psychromonas sp.]
MKKVDTGINIHNVCKLLNVPLSSYYKELEAHVSDPKTDLVVTRIQELHEEHLYCFGPRRMHKKLLKEGVTIGTFKVARLMKVSGIVAKIPKKPHYYPAGNEKPNISNILKRQFNPVTINTHWVGDITYIRNNQGWSYLATV